MQPIIKDKHGTARFKGNAVVERLLEVSQKAGYGLNELSYVDFPKEDQEQFAQLIGYSLGGYSDLSYVSDTSCETAWRMAAEKSETENEAKIAVLESKLKEVREGVKIAAACLFKVHLDDLTS